MAELAIISAIASVAAAGVTAAGTLAAGKAQEQAANYEAQQLDVQAKNRQAEAQVQAGELKRKKELALSNLQANAAASGFSATDPTSLALADEIARYGTFQEQLAQYGGTSERAGLEAQAEGRRMTGKAARIGSRYSAAGTILGGISTLAGKFPTGSPARASAGASYRYG